MKCLNCLQLYSALAEVNLLIDTSLNAPAIRSNL